MSNDRSPMAASPNAFTARLRAREPVTMVNVGGRNPDLMPLLARHGADAAFIDCERTGIGLDAAAELIVAARACGLPAAVRSHSRAGPELIRLLDRGADALVVPHIETAAQVEEAAELVRYACGEDAIRKSLVIQIETRSSLESLHAIAAVPGVDAFLIGPNDIAYELAGRRGRHTPQTLAAIDEACATLHGLGRSFGYPATTEELPLFQRRGANLRYVSVDWLIEAGMRACVPKEPIGARP